MERMGRTIHRVAVLGAGVMGAQIAAHFVNAGIETILFDLFSKEGEANALVNHSIQSLKTLKPSPLGYDGIEKHIIPANYETDLAKLKQCDFVIEAIAERLDWKLALYQKIIPFLHENAILATNTSGLSIQALAKSLPIEIKKQFCGVHFFNPPRYMKLVEMIPYPDNDLKMLNALETFLISSLGKGVVYAKDTPNFIGNRIGVFALLAVLHHAEELKLAPDVVDALTGLLIERPKSATFRTMDVVGLDTLSHVVSTLENSLPEDPWNTYFTLPSWIKLLIEKGALGQKSRKGIYQKNGSIIEFYDPEEKTYRVARGEIDPAVLKIFKENALPTAIMLCQKSSHPQAQLIWRSFRDLFHYCAYHMKAIADSIQDLDDAMCWGYGWQHGPFSIWQTGGWETFYNLIEQERQRGSTMSDVPFSIPQDLGLRKRTLPVYQRQTISEKHIVFETDSVEMWTEGDRLPILSFKTHRNCISEGVLEGINEAIARAEADYDALIIWQQQDHDFSVGLDLKQLLSLLEKNQISMMEKLVAAFQHTAMRLRYASVPTIAAIRGLTLGGACEFSMHTTQVVAAFETYMGLVEARVGLLPGGAGSKEMALRAAKNGSEGDYALYVKKYYEQIAYAKVSQSALDACRLGYLRPSDQVVMNADELLYFAKKKANALADLTYHPPLSPRFPVAGKTGIANLQTMLINLREGEFITDYEYQVGVKIAQVLCGGNIEAGSIVNEQWMLHLERDAVIALTQYPEMQTRIKQILKMGAT